MEESPRPSPLLLALDAVTDEGKQRGPWGIQQDT